MSFQDALFLPSQTVNEWKQAQGALEKRYLNQARSPHSRSFSEAAALFLVSGFHGTTAIHQEKLACDSGKLPCCAGHSLCRRRS